MCDLLLSAYNGNIEKYQSLRKSEYSIQERDCIIHGIYHYYDFAKWCKDNLSLNPKLYRAISASFIMNNDLSFIDKDNLPYCIWYPRQASESTYRELYYNYPELKYNIGRACAIAEYNDLYGELNLLPEVNILMCAKGVIRQKIMSSEVKYYIMNDYNRICVEPFEINHNYDNTCVNPNIYQRTIIGKPFYINNIYFDLLENNNISYTTYQYPNILSDDSLELFYLSTYNLPNYFNCNKDILILLFAYNGDYEKYKLLRRPMVIDYEFDCVIHGIYHHYDFAKWCKDNMNPIPKLKRAISASFIMNDDLSFIDKNNLPYCIWYPKQASKDTYRKLYHNYPELKYNIGRACTVANYNDLYDELELLPEVHILTEAHACNNDIIINKFSGINKIYNKLNDNNVSIPINEEYEYPGMIIKYETVKDLYYYYNMTESIDNCCINTNDIYCSLIRIDIFENGYVNMGVINEKLKYIKSKLCLINNEKIYDFRLINNEFIYDDTADNYADLLNLNIFD